MNYWASFKTGKGSKDTRNTDKAHITVNKLPRNAKSYTLLLHCTGKKVEHLIRILRKDMHCALPENVKPECVIVALSLVPTLLTSKSG